MAEGDLLVVLTVFLYYRYYDVCLGSLIDDCRYAGGKLKCETTDQYPNGFVSLKAEKGVAMYSRNS